MKIIGPTLEPDRCLPSLPPGYEAQPGCGFRDRTGHFSYEFNRVYGPPEQQDRRGPTCLLQEDLSYWGVTWPVSRGPGDERPAGRWVTYAQARELKGSRLTFERFSSPLGMREELPELLRLGDEPAAPPQAGVETITVGPLVIAST